MNPQTSIKFINNKSLTHREIVEYYKPTVSILDKYGIVINENEIDKFISNLFEYVNNYALIIIDLWNSKNNYDWNSIINKILTYPEKDDKNCNIVVATKQHLTKSLLRSKYVKIIDTI